MPKLVYPGVYVEEGSAGAPIEGVSTSGKALESVSAELRRALRTHAPGRTGSNESDPGVTLVEMLAFLTESLLSRATDIPERVRFEALLAGGALTALGKGIACTSVTRPHFFSGRLLDVDTLAAEQAYHREKLRRHNRALHGYGVVTGLSVGVESTPGSSLVVVDPGYAIDAEGEEICVRHRATLAAPATGDCAFVTLRYWEHLHPAAGEMPEEARWIEEACVIGIAPAVTAPAFALARLIRSAGHWQVDRGFATPRAR
jgi:hypothetical protein